MAEAAQRPPPPPCKRCRAADAPYRLRNDPACRSVTPRRRRFGLAHCPRRARAPARPPPPRRCPLADRAPRARRPCYADYVEAKAGRRLGALARDTRTSPRPAPRRYLAGLSFGASSAVMTRVLDDSARFHSSRKASPAFHALVVHVDTDLTAARRARPRAADAGTSTSTAADTHADADTPARRLLDRYRERFPNLAFECVHLGRALRLRTIDWPSLLPAAGPGHQRPGADGDGSHDDDVDRLRVFFDSLPSLTSRADVLRLLIRHVLLDIALRRGYTALLLGHTTTALAALTLSEVANGRGYSVPWQVNDGPYAVRTYARRPDDGPADEEPSRAQMPVHYILRELFRAEITQYLALSPALRELVPADDAAAADGRAIVSHKDVSIDDVMRRYFDGVEGPYEGIVANVVRTAGKLDRAPAAAGSGSCGMCGAALDEHGDSRWAGELGHDLEGEGGHGAGLCYGCRRSISG